MHSTIVGGSTAKRVINCPASVRMCEKMPPQPTSEYAAEGTRLHNLIAAHLTDDVDVSGEEKIVQALEALDELDPDNRALMAVEQKVEMPGMPGVFGSCDLLMKVGRTAIVLDWKFGDGVMVEAEGNHQLLFYAACAVSSTPWLFDNVEEVKLVIVQPPHMSVWTLTRAAFFDELSVFRGNLSLALREIDSNPAPVAGDWCRWCTAKPVCPAMTGLADRTLRKTLVDLPREQMGQLLADADMLEDWIRDLRALALTTMENGVSVPGYKLVAKRAVRKWVDESKAKAALLEHLPESDVMVSELVSPAQAEKLLKKQKIAPPGELVAAVSSGSTLASEDDPRPAIVQIGAQISAALSKI